MLNPTYFTVVMAAIAGVTGVFAGQPFDYFVNNWNVIGLKDYARGARVTPDNRLQLADAMVQIRVGRNAPCFICLRPGD